MKSAFCLSFFLLSQILLAQNFENRWEGFFSFGKVVDVSHGNDKLFAASENAVFTFDFTTREIKTITTIQGLSGDLISSIYYSETSDIIFIGYESGLIELVLEDNTILKVVDIINKAGISPTQKKINHFNEHSGRIYISTGFGISVYNPVRLEFMDTYFIGDMGQNASVNQTAVFDGFIYASMEDKVKRALVSSPNLIDYTQWNDVFNNGSLGVQAFANNLYMIDDLNSLYKLVGNGFQQIEMFQQPNVNIYSHGNYLTVVSARHCNVFDGNMNNIETITENINYYFLLSNALVYNGKTYLASLVNGILEIPFGSNQVTQILPQGPQLNKPFAIDASPGQLWTVFGEVNLTFNPYPLNQRGISHFENNIWTNINEDEVLGARSIVHVKINPDDPTIAYASSMIDGLLKIKDKKPFFLYDETNSALNAGYTEGAGADFSVRIFGSDFDRQGNLWFVQSGVEEGLHRLSTAGQIQSYDMTSVLPNPENGLNKLRVSNDGNIFFATSTNGLVGYNPTSKTFKKISENQGSGNLPSPNIRALAFDHRNQLWIGTFKGLRVLYNVGGFFDSGSNTDAQPIIILENDIAQELLFEQSITAIKVDGSNNKWVSTATSGVFYFSPNGNQTLLRFTKENSPLPSNNVQDIAIDPQSGVVYFATVSGLVAYKGTATAPRETLEYVRAYPNPVRPGFNGNVTIDGLTARANVKITDVNGNLVHEQVSEGGSILWDTTAFGRHRVASGVYFIMVTAADAVETKIAKVMIIR